jgi:3-dehydroquinate dehydratase
MCFTKAQLTAVLVNSSNQSPSGPQQRPSGGSNQSESVTQQTGSSNSLTIPPVIHINGTNPAIIQVGDTYSDLGATITGPAADLNLGIHFFLNGKPVETIQIDTSTAGTSTVNYVAIDPNGLTATSTRMVIVQTLVTTPTIETPIQNASTTATSSTAQ